MSTTPDRDETEDQPEVVPSNGHLVRNFLIVAGASLIIIIASVLRWIGGLQFGSPPGPDPLESVSAEDVLAQTQPVFDRLLEEASQLSGAQVAQADLDYVNYCNAASGANGVSYTSGRYTVSPASWSAIRELVRQTVADDPAWTTERCSAADDGTSADCYVFWRLDGVAEAYIHVGIAGYSSTPTPVQPPGIQTVYLQLFLPRCYPTDGTVWGGHYGYVTPATPGPWPMSSNAPPTPADSTPPTQRPT